MSKDNNNIIVNRIEANEIVIRPSNTTLVWDRIHKNKAISLPYSTVAKCVSTSSECGILVDKELILGTSKYKWYYDSKQKSEIAFGLACKTQNLSTSKGVLFMKKILVCTDDIVYFELQEECLLVVHKPSKSPHKQWVFTLEKNTTEVVSPWVGSLSNNGFHLKVNSDINAVISNDQYGNFNVDANISRNDNISKFRLMSIGADKQPEINTNTLNAVLRMSIDDSKSDTSKLWSSEKIKKQIDTVDVRNDIIRHFNDAKLHIKIDDDSTNTTTVWSSSKIKHEVESHSTKDQLLQHIDSHVFIDDSNVDSASLWSSSKINKCIEKLDNTKIVKNHIDNKKIHHVIDDENHSFNTLMSSKKIMQLHSDNISLINSHIDDNNLHCQIDDVSVSKTQAWSSLKITNAIQNVDNTKKVNTHIQDTDIHMRTDDRNISKETIWSSYKINEEIKSIDNTDQLKSHLDNRNIHVPVDNSSVSHCLWNSRKIQSEIDKSITSIIKDDSSNNDKTWSSGKIETEIHNSITSIISDKDTEPNTTWSGKKITQYVNRYNTEPRLNSHINDRSIHVQIDDDVIECNTLWSSEKIRSEINKITSTILEDQKGINIRIGDKLKTVESKLINRDSTNNFKNIIVESLQSNQNNFNGNEVITKAHLDKYIHDYKDAVNINSQLFISHVKIDKNPSAYLQMLSGDIIFATVLNTLSPFLTIDNKNVTNFTISKPLSYNMEALNNQTLGFKVDIQGVYHLNASISISCDNSTSRISFMVVKNDKLTDIGTVVSGFEDKMTQLKLDSIVELKSGDVITFCLKTQYLDTVVNFNYINMNCKRILVNST